jgi:Leucine-rich repeat (LRR) protein
MSLVLRGNSFSSVASRAFHGLVQLQRLDLSDCGIVTIESGAFDGLDGLQRMFLHGNRITEIEASELPPSLHGITIHDNRLVLGAVYSCTILHIVL